MKRKNNGSSMMETLILMPIFILIIQMAFALYSSYFSRRVSQYFLYDFLICLESGGAPFCQVKLKRKWHKILTFCKWKKLSVKQIGSTKKNFYSASLSFYLWGREHSVEESLVIAKY